MKARDAHAESKAASRARLNFHCQGLILAAESPEDARTIEESDPAVVSGLMTIAQIKPILVFAGTWPLREAAQAKGAQSPGAPQR